MATFCWLFLPISAFLCILWLCTEYERRQLKKLTLTYEQRYDRLWSNVFGSIDHRLAVAKVHAILKKSEQHKLNHLKLVDK